MNAAASTIYSRNADRQPNAERRGHARPDGAVLRDGGRDHGLMSRRRGWALPSRRRLSRGGGAAQIIQRG